METAPAGAYWLGPLVASFGGAILCMALAIMLVAWVADVSPRDITDGILNVLDGGDR
jgi:hypothetical protein